MNLQLAGAALTRGELSLSDIRHFALQCRMGSLAVGTDAAVLVLLAGKVTSFIERLEVNPATGDSLCAFVTRLASEIEQLRSAVLRGDDALIQALNAFAVEFSLDFPLTMSGPFVPEECAWEDTDRPRFLADKRSAAIDGEVQRGAEIVLQQLGDRRAP